jgi:hypothetical protein
VVESTALEMRRTRKGTVGSNPTLSAEGFPFNYRLLRMRISGTVMPSTGADSICSTGK